MHTKVFVSYASRDKAFVERELIPMLNDLEVDPWYADRQIIPARQWEAEIRRGLKECYWFLVVISEASIQSDWVRTEVHWALELKPDHIIPISVDNSDPGDCHLKLKLIQHIPWEEDSRNSHHLLESALNDSARGNHTNPENENSREVDVLVYQLRTLRATPDIEKVPFLFGCLSHQEEGIRGRAMQVIQKIGWDDVSSNIEKVAASGTRTDIDSILSGLASIDATDQTVSTLAKLCEILHGDLRDRSLALTERKRLSLQLGDMAKLFVNNHQPYEVVKVLGLGLFTASYLAKHKHSGQEVVIRVLRPELALRDDLRTQFIELTNRSTRYVHQMLAHTSFVNHFAQDNIYFCVRDYIDGHSLQNSLGAGQAFEPQQAIEILKQIVSALTPIHLRNEYHGGIKPSNIFLVSDYDVILGDPSLPVSLVTPNLPRLAYDYRYAAPESFSMNQTLGPQSDYYSLGCLAYELLCGEPPFKSDDPFQLANYHREVAAKAPSRINNSLNLDSDGLLLSLLEKDSGSRPATVNEVLQILNELSNHFLSPSKISVGTVAIIDTEKRREIPSDRTQIIMPHPGSWDMDSTYFKPAEIKEPGVTDSQGARSISTELVSADTSQPVADVYRLNVGEHVKGTGDILNDRFVLEESIGTGGMSSVYKALDRRKLEADDRNPYVAVKVLNQEFRAHPDSLIALQREAKKSQSLAHPNIVRVYDFDRDGSTVYMTMEYLTGQSLKQVLRAPGFKGLPEPESMRILEAIAEALRFAHNQGIIHADFKPGNIILTATGGVKLIDFGIARLFKHTDKDEMEATQFDAGSLGALTPSYASPEMIEQKDIDPRDDIYSLACIAYEIFTGRHPFSRMQSTEARDGGLEIERRNLSSQQFRALKSALEFDREKRTPTVKQFITELQKQNLTWFSKLFGIK